MIKKKSISNIFPLFLFFHLVIWTLVPTLSNVNLPLDTIEALAYGNDLQLGYDKYPPLFPLITEFVFQIFGKSQAERRLSSDKAARTTIGTCGRSKLLFPKS